MSHIVANVVGLMLYMPLVLTSSYRHHWLLLVTFHTFMVARFVFGIAKGCRLEANRRAL